MFRAGLNWATSLLRKRRRRPVVAGDVLVVVAGPGRIHQPITLRGPVGEVTAEPPGPG